MSNRAFLIINVVFGFVAIAILGAIIYESHKIQQDLREINFDIQNMYKALDEIE